MLDALGNAFVTTLGIVYILLGLYRKEPTDVIWGLIAISLGYPMTRLFRKEMRE